MGSEKLVSRVQSKERKHWPIIPAERGFIKGSSCVFRQQPSSSTRMVRIRWFARSSNIFALPKTHAMKSEFSFPGLRDNNSSPFNQSSTQGLVILTQSYWSHSTAMLISAVYLNYSNTQTNSIWRRVSSVVSNSSSLLGVSEWNSFLHLILAAWTSAEYSRIESSNFCKTFPGWHVYITNRAITQTWPWPR